MKSDRSELVLLTIFPMMLLYQQSATSKVRRSKASYPVFHQLLILSFHSHQLCALDLPGPSVHLNPILEILRQAPGGQWASVYKSEVGSGPHPVWKPARTDLSLVDNGDPERVLMLKVPVHY